MNKGNKNYKSNSEKFLSEIDNLSKINLIKILDVVLDIKEKAELAIGNKVRIPLLPIFVKFPSLIPADSPGMRDRYMDYRWDSLKFLKKIGAIEDFKLIKASHRWHQKIDVLIDKSNFKKVFKIINSKLKGK